MGLMLSQRNMEPKGQEALNPIFEFAAQAQYYENRMEWELAVHWYRRALACLPNLFGSDKKLHPLPTSTQESISFTPQHASRIYAALGHALMALGHQQDSSLAYHAAEALDPSNASEFEKTAPLQAAPRSVPENVTYPVAGAASVRVCDHSDLKDDVTLIMVTHCTRRLKKFEALSPPSNKLVTATYGSLLNVFGERIAACPKLMCYDHNPNGTERDTQYGLSIESFSRQNGFALQRYNGAGLFNVLNQTIRSVETPYIFFVEHDWMFRGEGISLPAVIEMMKDDPSINTIRFNKRVNCLNGQDFLMAVDSNPRTYPLLRTSSYSNNPGIIRTDKLKNEWLPICEEALRLVSDQLGGRAFGIEEILFKKYVQDIREIGFTKAHDQWGLYVFGGAGDPARITHLGE